MSDQDRIQRERHVREIAQRVTEDLSQEGRLIAGGWRAFEILTGLERAPELQRSEMKLAYYSGAQHLFASIMNILEEGQEPTEGDLNKVTAIHEELEQWVRQQKAQQ